MKAWLIYLQFLLHGRLGSGLSGWWPALACTTFVTFRYHNHDADVFCQQPVISNVLSNKEILKLVNAEGTRADD